ncbi:MAG TPA: 2-C-methyl-D-erythritol 4-phosphate cytidylyltransferase [Egibacteraceae bacterium]|nr:2-C-methyl-D-erythritol 4-phosphate cytidylyltransferase [Egibacteraceae bacterium]
MTTTAAVLVAGGAGERLGLPQPKAFVPLAGEPMLARAARALSAAGVFARIVVVVPEGWQERARELCADVDAELTVCAGGRTRQESVARGVAHAAEDVVAVHDAARALVPPELVRDVVAALTDQWDAVAPAVPIVDTVKRVDPDDGRVLETVGRATLRAVQTPQVFRRDLLTRLHGEAHGADATDDLLLVEQAGGRVRLLDGDVRNLKVTTAADLLFAEALLREDARA